MLIACCCPFPFTVVHNVQLQAIRAQANAAAASPSSHSSAPLLPSAPHPHSQQPPISTSSATDGPAAPPPSQVDALLGPVPTHSHSHAVRAQGSGFVQDGSVLGSAASAAAAAAGGAETVQDGGQAGAGGC